MFQSILTGLTSLRDFLSRSFFIGAFLPTIMFFLINGIILYVWNWPFHNWFRLDVLDATVLDKTATVAILFFFVWLSSYLVSALTPLWTRTLEGRNWFNWLRVPGIEYHVKRFDEIQKRINAAVEIYASIDGDRQKWKEQIEKAFNDVQTANEQTIPSPSTRELITKLKKASATAKELVMHNDLEELVNTYCQEILAKHNNPVLQKYSNDIKLLWDAAYNRALQEHVSLATDRNLEFGNEEDVAPTRFGNVGKSAQAFAMRAYKCNLGLLLSSLQRAIAKEQDTAKTLEDCKSQLDFFVACFWLSLFQSLIWAIVFACSGEPVGAILAAIIGPLICWLLWYGAAVEQYRVLQSLLISALNSSLRFQILTELRMEFPSDIAQERELWNSISMAIGFGEPQILKYQIPK